MTPTSTLSYHGRPIRLRGTMLNLTDMWRAAGCPEYRRPTSWLLLEETMRFRAHAEAHWTEREEPAADNVVDDHIIHLDPDGFVATAAWPQRRHLGALAARAVLRPVSLPRVPHLVQHGRSAAAMEWRVDLPAADHDPLLPHLAQQFRDLHRRLDDPRPARRGPDVPAALSSQEHPARKRRRDFSGAAPKATIIKVGGGRALRRPVPLLQPRARPHRDRPANARRRVRPLLSSRA